MDYDLATRVVRDLGLTLFDGVDTHVEAAVEAAVMARGFPSPRRITLAGLFVLQLLGQVAPLGGGRMRPGCHSGGTNFETFSSADAAIDSCVALATSHGYGVQSTFNRAQTHALLDDGADSTPGNWVRHLGSKAKREPAAARQANSRRDVILQRLGLADAVCKGQLQMPEGAIADYDMLLDDTPTPNTSKGSADSKCQNHECSRTCLDKARGTFEEAQVLCRSRRFEEARPYFQDGTLRMAAYSKKIECNAGFPRWGEGWRLNKEWAQLALDLSLGAGECWLNLANFPDAILECTTALLLEPDNLQALYTRGLACKHLAETAKRRTGLATESQTAPTWRCPDRHRLLRQAWKVLFPDLYAFLTHK